MNKCDICLVEWDPRQQSHHRGPDCVSGLKGMIDGLYAMSKKIEKAIQDHTDTCHAKEEATVGAFASQRDDFAALIKRFEKLANRVTILEHPKMVSSKTGGG